MTEEGRAAFRVPGQETLLADWRVNILMSFWRKALLTPLCILYS